jgi:hypothetical protein
LSDAGTAALREETIHSPGADTSGFGRPSRVGPFEENPDAAPSAAESGRQVVPEFGSAFGQHDRVT